MNKLSTQTSPYLLQHAHNPVHWQPWGKEALEQAQREDKAIIVSIGYSTCHWCHVMERESFENQEIADIMNEHFVCIKVDREERPDVDNVYMDAIQVMGLAGGWPLNVFLLPDRRPFYGGTYFKPNQWESVCTQIANAFAQHREEIEESAANFADNIALSVVDKYGLEPVQELLEHDEMAHVCHQIKKSFDHQRGGLDRSPKFPMPSLWLFLLRYAHCYQDQEISTHVLHTLRAMAFGGINDQVGGGFARYSVDGEWFCPHFEKMLYDNGQLLQLYSEAFQATGEHLFKQVITRTISNFIVPMKDPKGGFLSAMDADSEGVEGKYYIWTYQDLQRLIGEHNFPLFEQYYNVTPQGNWEEGNNILYRRMTDEDFLKKVYNLEEVDKGSLLALEEQVILWRSLLFTERASRILPSTDHKIITSWNAITMHGLILAYRAIGNEDYIQMALDCAHFVQEHLLEGDKLYRLYTNGQRSTEAFLDDYALLIKALIELYQVTFEEHWLALSHQLTEAVIKDFWDPKDELFFFHRHNPEELIAHQKELFDSVIPSSNAVMAKNLLLLASMLGKEDYEAMALKMLSRVKNLILKDVKYTSAWADVALHLLTARPELAIVGKDCHKYRKIIDQAYKPFKIVVGAQQYSPQSLSPLLHDRPPIEDKTALYLCQHQRCDLPSTDPKNIQDRLMDL